MMGDVIEGYVQVYPVTDKREGKKGLVWGRGGWHFGELVSLWVEMAGERHGVGPPPTPRHLHACFFALFFPPRAWGGGGRDGGEA